MSNKKMNEVRLDFHVSTGKLNFYLELFGDRLKEREKYKVHEGLDAIHFYLVNKYGWLPAVVKSMSYEDLRFLLAEEMHGFTVRED
jgi:hypothetical protein